AALGCPLIRIINSARRRGLSILEWRLVIGNAGNDRRISAGVHGKGAALGDAVAGGPGIISRVLQGVARRIPAVIIVEIDRGQSLGADLAANVVIKDVIELDAATVFHDFAKADLSRAGF